jgi:hypothetical protein
MKVLGTLSEMLTATSASNLHGKDGERAVFPLVVCEFMMWIGSIPEEI